MKRLLWLSIALFTLNTNTMAQKGFKLEREITINVSADELWNMVGPGFVEVYRWSSNVDHAQGSGTPEFEGAVCSERSCDLNVKGFSSISEILIKYNAQQMNLAYEVKSGMPSFVTKAANDWTVISIDDTHSKLVMKAEFQSKGLMGALMNGMMEKKMRQTLDTVLNDAKVFAETGQQSEAKKERVAQLAKKTKQAA